MLEEKDIYIKAYRSLEAFLVLQCRASGQSLDLCSRLLKELCVSAIEYGRVTASVRNAVIEASTGDSYENY